MSSFGPSFGSSQPTDPQWAQFVEQAVARLEAGEPVDVEAIVGTRVEYADRLRDLLPAIEGLLRLPPATSRTPGTAPPDISPSRAELGDFRLIREIGRGGMGTVFEAEQISMGRRVALKILPFATLADDKSLQRFHNEVRAAAALDHPHIVSVYSVGEERGIHFYAMRLIHGQTLAESIEHLRRLHNGATPTVDRREGESEAAELTDTVIAGHSNPSTLTGTQSLRARFRAIAQLGIDVAEALQHAHDQGVIHRDIKPANLLVDTSGKIHVADFGLARIGAEAGLTRTGDVVGTLRYMPPEQVLGRHLTIDHRSDIYSLGVTLYELLTLTPAYEAADHAELLRQVAFLEPRPPRRIDPAIPVELDTIVLKAMSKEPEGRYASAQELADDLRRFLADQPIKAKPPTLFDRVRKLSRRHSRAIPAIGVGLILLTGILAAAVVQIAQSRSRALAALDATSDLLYAANVSQGYDAWDEGWHAEAYEILDRHRDDPEVRRGLEWRLLRAAVAPPKSVELTGHEGGVRELALFPDGERLASVGEDGTLRIWDWQTRRELQTIAVANQALSALAISADGRYLATGSNVLMLFDLEENASRRPIYASLYTFESLAFSADGEQLAAGVRYHDVTLLSLNKFRAKHTHSGARVSSLEFMPDGNLLVPMNEAPDDPHGRESITIRDGELNEVREFRAPIGLKVARRSPDGKLIVAGGRNSTAMIFDAATGELLATTPRARSELHDVAFAPNSRLFAVGYANGIAEVYEFHKGELLGRTRPTIATFRAHRGEVHSLRFLNDHTLATAGADEPIRIWTLGWGAVKSYALGPPPIDVKLSPDGTCFAYVSKRGCRLCDTASGRKLANFASQIAGGSTAAWHPDGTRVAVCLESPANQRICLIDRTGRVVQSLTHTGNIHEVAFSPDGRLLASTGSKCLRVHEVDTGRTVANLRFDSTSWAVAFSPDGQYLAYSTQSGPLTLLKVDDRSRVLELKHGRHCGCLAMSHDGSLLAAGHGDGMIRLWELPSGDLKCELSGHEQGVNDIAFSRSGQTLVSAASDGTVRMWSLKHEREFGTLFRTLSPDTHTPEHATNRLSLSPDGRYLVVGDGQLESLHNVHVWHLGDDQTFIPLE